jgi:hypothetical protein
MISMRRRVFALSAIVAVGAFTAALVFGPVGGKTTVLGQFTVVQQVSASTGDPKTTEATARQHGLADLAQLRPDIKGLRVNAASFARGVREVSAHGGMVTYKSTGSINVWLLEVSAPRQGGFAHVIGLVVIDADTGKVVSDGIGAYN